jgi:hypothetical protein
MLFKILALSGISHRTSLNQKLLDTAALKYQATPVHMAGAPANSEVPSLEKCPLRVVVPRLRAMPAFVLRGNDFNFANSCSIKVRIVRGKIDLMRYRLMYKCGFLLEDPRTA